MRAGKLNQRVTIQAPASGVDDLGQPLTGWDTVAELWAEVKDQSGREYVSAGASQAEVLTTITIRPRSGLVAAMRVLHGADTYNIEAVLKPSRDVMSLMCKRLTA